MKIIKQTIEQNKEYLYAPIKLLPLPVLVSKKEFTEYNQQKTEQESILAMSKKHSQPTLNLYNKQLIHTERTYNRQKDKEILISSISRLYDKDDINFHLPVNLQNNHSNDKLNVDNMNFLRRKSSVTNTTRQKENSEIFKDFSNFSIKKLRKSTENDLNLDKLHITNSSIQKHNVQSSFINCSQISLINKHEMLNTQNDSLCSLDSADINPNLPQIEDQKNKGEGRILESTSNNKLNKIFLSACKKPKKYRIKIHKDKKEISGKVPNLIQQPEETKEIQENKLITAREYRIQNIDLDRIREQVKSKDIGGISKIYSYIRHETSKEHVQQAKFDEFMGRSRSIPKISYYQSENSAQKKKDTSNILSFNQPFFELGRTKSKDNKTSREPAPEVKTDTIPFIEKFMNKITKQTRSNSSSMGYDIFNNFKYSTSNIDETMKQKVTLAQVMKEIAEPFLLQKWQIKRSSSIEPRKKMKYVNELVKIQKLADSMRQDSNINNK